MNYKYTTQVPNKALDDFLPSLKGAEFKLLMIIIRQTYGWHKKRDKMNYSQLISKTRLSRRVIADSIQNLINKNIISVTDYYGKSLHVPELRKGKTGIYFASCFDAHTQKDSKVSTSEHDRVHKSLHNKTNVSKPTQQKSFSTQKVHRISDIERLKQILQEKKSNN